MNCFDPLSSVLSQIDTLVSALNKKTVKNFTSELQNLASNWGTDAELHLLRCLISAIDSNSDNRNPFKETSHTQLLRDLLLQNLSKPSFVANFCSAFDTQIKNTKVSSATLAHFFKSLRITRVQEVILGFVLLQSARNDTKNVAFEFLKKKLPELLHCHASPSTARETGIFDCSVELIHFLLLSIVRHPKISVAADLIDNFLESLRHEFPRHRVPLVLGPFLYNAAKDDGVLDLLLTTSTEPLTSSSIDNTLIAPSGEYTVNMDGVGINGSSAAVIKTITGSLALQIQEIGYVFCQDVDSCKKHMVALGVQTLTAGNVAHILAMMVRTHSNLRNGTVVPVTWIDENKDNADELTSWKVESFIQVVLTMVPSMNWTEVFGELDHPGFAVKDRAGLTLLTKALMLGLKDSPFPVSVLYTMWANNKEGQLSWIQQILRNPDIFCFTDHSHRPVQTLDILKASPDESKEIQAWRSLDLVEVLLSLGNVPGLSAYVQECLRFPVQSCPELLALALIQTGLPMTSFRQELLIGLFQLLLGGQAKESRLMILNFALSGPVPSQDQLRQCVLHSMAEWYNRNADIFDRLTKIFQIAIKLKILLDLLNLPQFQFTIDLACLASRCDYVNLNRWLTEKVQAHGEHFVQSCVQFLKRRYPALAATFAGDQQRMMAAANSGPQLSFDIVSSILNLLQSVASHVQAPLASEIAKMCGQFSALASTQPGVSSAAAVATGGMAAGPPGPAAPSQLPTVASTPNLAAAASAAGVVGGVPASATASGCRTPVPAAGKSYGNFGASLFGLATTDASFIPASLNTVNFGKVESVPAHLNAAVPGALFGGATDFSSHSIFGNPNFQNLGGQQSSASPSTVAGLHNLGMGSGAFQDPLSSLIKPVATGWGAGFAAAAAASATAPTSALLVTQRPTTTVIPQTLNAAMMNEPNTPDITQTFSESTQEEANSYFQQIYTQPPQPCMSIEQFLEVLKRYKESTDKKQLDVFACMIKNLFEEYNFFEQYPDKELHITALLFGGVIREGLVSGMPLMFALRVVLEALKKDPSVSNLFNFGVVAIDQFKTRVKEYPRYCQSLLQLPRIQELSSRILEYIQYGTKEEWPPSHQQTTTASVTRSQTPAPHLTIGPTAPVTTTPAVVSQGGATFVAAPLSSTASKPAATLNATNIDTLVHATAKEDSKVAVPSESVTEKVAFLFNNLSQMNMNQKVSEMKTMILDEHLPWLAQYLVMKRVSAESNFHNLYSNFVSALGNKTLNALSLKETYRNIKILLRSDKAAANFSDRTLLKNLGHWLGMSTLMLNKPILHKDLDLKSLLLEAFWKGQQELLYVVPFIAKILESCQKSRVFKPPNPWTKAILSVLAELHQQPDLKLNLKFEIEVLFRHLNIELPAIKINNILKDPVVMERAVKEPQLSNPQRLEKPTMTTSVLQPSPIPPSAVGTVISAAMPSVEEHAGATQASVTPTPTVARFSYHDIFVNSFQGLLPHISVNASLPIFQVNPPLKSLVKAAIEHAVKEFMIPVADRAIKIAMTTTENVIKKDFALDGDENRMRLAAQNMARSLTAGMAMITCRDYLFCGIQKYLEQGFYSSIRGATTEQQCMIKEAVQAITVDNVELAQCFIVKFAAERVCIEIDKRLTSEFEARRHARAESRPFASSSAAVAIVDRLPDSIRPRQGAADAQQLAVYDEFGRQVPGFKPQAAQQPEDLFGSVVAAAATVAAPPQPSQTAFALQPSVAAARHFWPAPATGGSHGAEDETLFQQLLRDIEARLQMAQPHTVQSVLAFQGVVALHEALAMASQNPRDTIGAQLLVQKLVDIVLEYYTPRLLTHQQQHIDQNEFKEWNHLLSETFLGACKNFTFIFGAQWVQKQVTKTLIDCRQESRFNVDAIELLLRNNLINMITYDLQLATAMENGLHYKAVNFAQHLLRRLFVEQSTSHALSENDLSNTIEMLTRIGNTRMGQAADGPAAFGRQGTMEDFGATFNRNAMLNAAAAQPFVPSMAPSASAVLGQLGGTPSSSMAVAAAAQAAAVAAAQQQRAAAGGAAGSSYLTQLESGVMFVREYSGNDPPGLQEKAEFLLREWVAMHHSPAAAKEPSKAFSTIVSQMHQHGILKSDDLITRFFRLCTEMCVDLCYRALTDSSSSPNVVRARCFHTLDAFVLLIALLVKHSGDGQHATKVSLLNKVLGIIAGVLVQEHKVRREDFHQLPFHRIFITLFLELTAPDPLLEPIHVDILTAFCHTLHVIQPRYNPAFTFAWLDIIGHRAFIGRVLINTVSQKAWSMYAQLLTDHLRFLAPFLRNIEFQKPVALVYVGTLRILLVLLHDLPEFLCDYHYTLCDVIPPNCVQLRNLILSAYPRNMRLPDPFMPNLKVDQLPEINSSPRIVVNFVQAIQPATLKNELDNYLKNRAPVSFLSELRSKLQLSNEPGQKYNMALINAVVLYVGAQAIQAIQDKEQRPGIQTIAHTAHMDIFQNLAVDLDTEGRYLFFNAIANQLRYPNSHTHYFSCTLLYLFAEANSEAIQEQITRILIERLVAVRPHPWGLLITFIELIKNPIYKFWTHQFVRCAPEIENLFDSIARSCMVKHTSEAP